MRIPPPLDTHAHVDPGIEASELRKLGAFIFAMTRSLDEFEAVRSRSDLRALWGVGVHPGLVRAQKAFAVERFRQQIQDTPLVGEVGLDGSSRVPIELQTATFRNVLEELQRHPRIVSVHSSGAHLRVLRELHRTPVEGVILHWWTGGAEVTEEAVRLGCYFSLSPAMTSSEETVRAIPPHRLLTETDHPYGDRRTRGAKPGRVSEVEQNLAGLRGIDSRVQRIEVWANFAKLVDAAGVGAALPYEWRTTLRGGDRR
ncbi:TatD family deoxyribonuclease [Rathayibacter sp. AY1G9]|uniref:TatD family hydrolase n=1 Tax=Rathayibacter sp. AY1G9 TaxID=2080565 RepID=UPI000CE7B444|nr:TatD family hydrolase [Rathayibacter sp. AY1G9]PPH01430.1 TatD family deoxyribonuclease [Rathayibacter sp. AY1G9]